jgi:4-amino-4-deoxy-L-arabinose transferase-like glycosyltransferase
MTHSSHGSVQPSRGTRYASRIELTLVVLLLLLAFFFRTYELTGLDLGLEHDEVAEWQIADGIRHGEHALFFKEAYGQEPLFLYLMAGSIALFGDNVFAIRFTSVFVAMLTLAASYRLLRRMFSPTVALVALAGMSIALWPVFWGRIGLRAMTLPLMLALGFDWLWRGLTSEIKTEGKRDGENERLSLSRRLSVLPSLRPFIIAGVFFGLSAYTYLSSRALPILLMIFTLYLALFARKKMAGKWRGLFVCFIVAGLVALPLVITLLTRPDLQFRVSEVSGPLDKALQGDASEVATNIGRAFGMFTGQGDTTVRDNWPNRPVFPEMMGQWLFLGGAIVAFTRLRQPRYVLALLWIGVMLILTIVTTGAPNFTRTLGALPMVFAMPGIAVEALLFWAPRLFPLQMYDRVSRVTNVLIVTGLIVVLGVNAVSTYEDYFIKWPQHPETQFVFQADFAAIAKDIDASDVMDVSVGGLSNDTMDDPSLYLLRQRKDVRVRWFNSADQPTSSGGALIHAGQPGAAYVYVPSIVPLSPTLAWYLTTGPTKTVFQTKNFARYTPYPFLPNDPFMEARRFKDTAWFIKGILDTSSVPAGGTAELHTVWVSAEPVHYPKRIFVHLVDVATGKIIAQHDGLDAPAQFWGMNDEVVQVHKLPIPKDAVPGEYELRVGLYDPISGVRVPLSFGLGANRGKDGPDYIVLGTIEVIR